MTEFGYRLPERAADGNKGTFGTVTVIGGCENYLGAPMLCGKAAYRAGCGLVEMLVPRVVRDCGAGSFPEAIWNCAAFESGQVPSRKNCVAVIGPGLGTGEEISAKLPSLIRSASESCRQLILDADALNLLAKNTAWYEGIPENCVLTPHPGEMSRLSGSSIEAVQKDREKTAIEHARKWRQIVLLKGAHTIIAAPDGRETILPYADSALAVAGSGDVLAGVIGGLTAQGMDPFEAACLGADIHARAGLLAAAHYGNPYSVMAGDILAFIPAAISSQ